LTDIFLSLLTETLLTDAVLTNAALTCIILTEILESVVFLSDTLTNTKFDEFILRKWCKVTTRWDDNEMRWQRDDMTMWDDDVRWKKTRCDEKDKQH
jgi:hypothetical protein